MDDERHLAEAFRLAAKGHAEGGCPIGAVLVDNDLDVVARTLERITGAPPAVAVDDLRGY